MSGSRPTFVDGDDLAGALSRKFPDRIVCGQCLMTFETGAAPAQVEGPMGCPQCKRRFWIGGKTSHGWKPVCYLKGSTA